MNKKDDDSQTYEELAERLKSNLDEDRSRLSEFLSRLIRVVSEDDDRVIIAADAVAKISNALTQQTHLSIDVMKIVAKTRSVKDDNTTSIDDAIGHPFVEADAEKDPN